MIATKGGIWKTGPGLFHRDSRPEALRAVCEACLLHLKRDRLDLFQLHWVDDDGPLGRGHRRPAAAGRGRQGAVIGICNVTAAQAEEAMAMAPIASVQNRFALRDEEHRPVLELCAAKGIAFLPYGPLGAKPFEQDAPLTRATGKIADIAQRPRCHHGSDRPGVAPGAGTGRAADPGDDERRSSRGECRGGRGKSQRRGDLAALR